MVVGKQDYLKSLSTNIDSYKQNIFHPHQPNFHYSIFINQITALPLSFYCTNGRWPLHNCWRFFTANKIFNNSKLILWIPSISIATDAALLPVIAEVAVVNYQHIFCCFLNHIIHHIQFPMSVWAYLGKYYQLINHIVIIKCFGYSKILCWLRWLPKCLLNASLFTSVALEPSAATTLQPFHRFTASWLNWYQVLHKNLFH